MAARFIKASLAAVIRSPLEESLGVHATRGASKSRALFTVFAHYLIELRQTEH